MSNMISFGAETFAAEISHVRLSTRKRKRIELNCNIYFHRTLGQDSLNFPPDLKFY